MCTQVVHGDVGADHQIADRPGGMNLPGPRRGHHPGCDVHCDPAHTALAQFDLAGVQPGPDLQADAGQLLPDGGCAADRPAWAIEGGQDAVASGLDESALELLRGWRWPNRWSPARLAAHVWTRASSAPQLVHLGHLSLRNFEGIPIG